MLFCKEKSWTSQQLSHHLTRIRYYNITQINIGYIFIPLFDETKRFHLHDMLLFNIQVGSPSSVRSFTAPEVSLEQALLACGINNEGYTITNKLNELARQRSRHVANSKFYTKGS